MFKVSGQVKLHDMGENTYLLGCPLRRTFFRAWEFHREIFGYGHSHVVETHSRAVGVEVEIGDFCLVH